MRLLAPDDGNGDGGEATSLITSKEAEGTGDATKTTAGADKTAAGTQVDANAEATTKATEAAALEKAVAGLALKLPEGFDPKDATLADFKKMAAQAGLDATKAQGFFDFHHKQLTGSVEKATKALEQKFVEDLAASRKEWVGSLKADKQFGGDKFNETVVTAQKVFARYGDKVPELKEMLESTGWGDHPAMVKLFTLIGRDLKEDTVARNTTNANAPQPRPKGTVGSDWSLLYPNSPELHH